MARLGRRAAYEERVRAVQAVERGQRAEIVAEVLGFARSTVFGWVQAARLGGEQALETRPTPGPPPRLSARQMQRLRKALVVRDPRQLQFEFALWTRALVAELIEREFEIKLSLATVGLILHQLGMSPQRPVYRVWQADPAAVGAWKQSTYPTIVAAAKRQDAAIFFGDEASV